MTAVAPVWEGITIIPDEVTQAKQGPARDHCGDAVQPWRFFVRTLAW